MSSNIKKFSTYDAALVWMTSEVDDPYQDNERFAYLDDASALEQYKLLLNEGCCGFFDEEIIVSGKPARIGCNFGH